MMKEKEKKNEKEKKTKLKKEIYETMHENIIKYKLLATSAATYSRY